MFQGNTYEVNGYKFDKKISNLITLVQETTIEGHLVVLVLCGFCVAFVWLFFVLKGEPNAVFIGRET